VKDDTGIYVEARIHAPLDRVWQLTQEPSLHQQWDLRFSEIEYLPRENSEEPQRFLYETRIGFGLRIRGTGESIAQHTTAQGDTTSSLRFESSDRKSLITNGSGYWRYIPTSAGLRFLTWYDYQVRFGSLGKLIDRLAFRPLIGWATAWSFDCLRLWAEEKQPAAASIRLAAIHAVARISIATIWVWHGLVPKLIYRQVEEQRMLADAGMPLSLLPWIGALEILFGLVMLCTWHRRQIFLVNVVLMVLATIAVAVRSPEYLAHAFNPITLNLGVTALALVGWMSSRVLPSSRHCLRTAPTEQR
jgi:uncharacterized membrane protein YphA (DoxX/SURF4 family)